MLVTPDITSILDLLRYRKISCQMVYNIRNQSSDFVHITVSAILSNIIYVSDELYSADQLTVKDCRIRYTVCYV